MTCVVGAVDEKSRKMHIASDSLYTDGQRRIVGKTDKIFACGDYLVGFCGSPRAIQIIRYGAALPTPPSNHDRLEKFMCTKFADHLRELFKKTGFMVKNEQSNSGGTEQFGEAVFMAMTKGRIFLCFPDFLMEESTDNYNAIGSGEELALGSMFTSKYIRDYQKRMTNAIAAASYHCETVGGPIRHLSMEY